MKHHPVGAGVLAALAAMLTSMAALSASPEFCSSGDGQKGYDQGHQLQSNLLRSNFERHFTCGSLELFIQAVRVDFEGGSSADLYLQCRDVGIVNAMDDTIRAIAERCGKQCTDSGASIGRLGAEQYCGIWKVLGQSMAMAAMDSAAPPIPTCNLATQQACRSAFVSEVDSHPACKASAAQDPHYNEQVDQACAFLR